MQQQIFRAGLGRRLRPAVALGAVLPIVGALLGGRESLERMGCRAYFTSSSPDAVLGAGVPDTAERAALERARRFRGDGRVGPLRWAKVHRTTGDVELGPVRQGVVPLSGPTTTITDSDYGYPIAVSDLLGVLRVSDGRPLWSRRSGQFGKAEPYGVSMAETFDRGTGRFYTATFDPLTGTGRWCAGWSEDTLTWPSPTGRGALIPVDDGTVLVPGRSLARVDARNGHRLWVTAPAEAPYQQVVSGDGALVAATDRGVDVGIVGLADPLSELAAFRLSDGRPLWKIADRAPADDRALVQQWALTERKVLGVAAGRVLVAEAPGGVPPGRDRGEYLPKSGRLAAYDLTDGRLRWSRPFRIGQRNERVNLTVAGERVLVAEPDRHITAFHAADGSREWSSSVPKMPDLQREALTARRLYVPGPKNGLLVLDLATGHATHSLRNIPQIRAIAVTTGTLVAQTSHVTLAFSLPGH